MKVTREEISEMFLGETAIVERILNNDERSGAQIDQGIIKAFFPGNYLLLQHQGRIEMISFKSAAYTIKRVEALSIQNPISYASTDKENEYSVGVEKRKFVA